MKLILQTILAITVGGVAQAQTFSADDLARRTVERRAVEAVIWGMPAVNTELMRQEMLTNAASRTACELTPGCRPANSIRVGLSARIGR